MSDAVEEVRGYADSWEKQGFPRGAANLRALLREAEAWRMVDAVATVIDCSRSSRECGIGDYAHVCSAVIHKARAHAEGKDDVQPKQDDSRP